MKGTLVALYVILGIFCKDANAYRCEYDHVDWTSDRVPVYVHYDPNVSSGPGMGLRYAWDMTEVDVEFAVIRTLNILNEEVGGRHKLQYAGTTTSTTMPLGGIVLYSKECSDTSTGADLGAGGVTHRATNGFSVSGAYIYFYKYTGNTLDQCGLAGYNLNEASSNDVIGLLIHELGHGFYNTRHPDGTNNAPCSEWTSEPTIMRGSSGDFPRRHRVIKDWDRWAFQANHTTRAPSGQLFKTYRNASSWGAAAATAAANGRGFLYRPGSVGDAPIRNIGYIYSSSSTPNTYGVGTSRNGRYDSGFLVTEFSPSNNLFRPVATAMKFGGSTILAAYIKNIYAPGSYDADLGYVCWRTSNDAGITFNAEHCESTWVSNRNGLTAAYMPQWDRFVIGFIADSSASDKSVRLGIVSTAGVVVSVYAVSTATSWHAPAIACPPSSVVRNPCRVVWEEDTNAGCLAMADFGYSVRTGFLISAIMRPACMPMYDTPGLVFDSAVNAFVLAITSKNDAIYSYTSGVNSTFWSGYGDIWNQSGSFVLSAVLGYRTNKSLSQAWFVKYP